MSSRWLELAVLAAAMSWLLGTAGAQTPRTEVGRSRAPADSVRLPVVVETDGQVLAGRLLQGIGLRGKKPTTTLPTAELADRALRWLHAEARYLARIETAERRAVPAPHHYLRIREGPALPIRQIAVRWQTGEKDGEFQGLREIHDAARASSPATLQTGIAGIIEALGERGYPFAQVTIDSMYLTGAENGPPGVGLVLRITPGSVVRIDSILIAGNRITKTAVILRELPVRPGMPYSLSRLTAVRPRLMRLRYFKGVREPELLLTEGGAGVLKVTVEEGNSNAFNGVAGYNPGTGNESGYLTGLVDLKFGNLFGTGRLVAARWEKRSRETQELALRYREPWLLGYPLHVEGGFQQRIQDTLYVERTWDLQAEWPLLENMRLVGSLRRSSISPDSVGRVLFAIPPSRALAAGIGLRYEATDDPINPRRGASYATTIETIAKKVLPLDSTGSKNDFSQKKLTVDLNWYQPLWRFQVLAIGLHWRQVTSSEPLIPLTDQYRFGGATTLRGYREEQFRGSRIAWGNFEYRYLLGPRSRAVLFYDLGYFYLAEATATLEKLRHSFGFGFRIETRLGIVGVDYGLGQGDALLQGKVHVSLVNSF